MVRPQSSKPLNNPIPYDLNRPDHGLGCFVAAVSHVVLGLASRAFRASGACYLLVQNSCPLRELIVVRHNRHLGPDERSELRPGGALQRAYYPESNNEIRRPEVEVAWRGVESRAVAHRSFLSSTQLKGVARIMTINAAVERRRVLATSGSPVQFPVGTHAKHDLFPHAHREPLFKAVGIRAYATGDTLQFEGDEACHVMIIKSGSAKVYKQMADGRTAVVGFLYDGDYIGLAASEVCSSGVEALEPVQVWRFPRSQFRQLVSAYPRLEASILRHVTSDLEAAQGQMLLLSRKTAIERLASFLLQQALREHEDTAGDVNVSFHMSRGDIADFLGLTTETVSRCFTRLCRAGLIRLQSATVMVLMDRPKLEGVAAGSVPSADAQCEFFAPPP